MGDLKTFAGASWRTSSLRSFFTPERSTRSPAVSEQNLRPTYRPDVDGLRAMAILAVVSYHVFPDQIPGGFLGVDVFFVISGFLISTIIFKSLANSTFSFVEFYVHRARRILPPLILIVAFCLFVGWNALLPSEFILLGKHIAASAGFLENFVLWHEAGYFDTSTALKPLMHIWSLSIEEQFYVIFPLAIVYAWRLRLGLLVFVALVGIASFADYIYVIHYDAVAAFFSPQTRYWELMAGAVLAHLKLDRDAIRLNTSPGSGTRTEHDALRNTSTRMLRGRAFAALRNPAISFLGLAFVAIAMFSTDRNAALLYPGTGSPLAVMGTTMLIFSGPSAWINRILLSNRAAVFIGLVSYPLYLWHWPLISYLTIVYGKYPEPYQRIGVLLLSFILAVLTFLFVERPIRRIGNHKSKVAGALIIGTASLVVLGISSKHFFRGYDPQTEKILQSWNFTDYPTPADARADKKYQFSIVGERNDQNRVFFIGDSHSTQYRNAVAAVLKRHKAEKGLPEVMFLESASWGGSIAPPSLSEIVNDKAVSIVVVANFWSLRYGSDKVNYSIRCCGEGLMQTVGRTPAPLTEEQMAAQDAELENVIESLKRAGKQVYVILDNPFGEELAPRSFLRRSFFQGIKVVEGVPLSTKIALERTEPIRSRVMEVAQRAGAALIDPIEYLCDAQVCPALLPDGTPTYKDYDHLSLDALLHRVFYLDFIGHPTATRWRNDEHR